LAEKRAAQLRGEFESRLAEQARTLALAEITATDAYAPILAAVLRRETTPYAAVAALTANWNKRRR